MRIACITFFDSTQLGGGRTPAFAFANIAHEGLGHDCRVFDPDTINEFDENDFDFVFLNTPPPRGDEMFLHDIKKVKFAVMIHCEEDLKKYPCFPDLVRMPNCSAMLHIDPEDYFYAPFHENRIFWHPCCMPEFIAPRHSNKYRPALSPVKQDGVLYAGRIADWKTPVQMEKICDKYNFRYSFSGERYMDHEFKNHFRKAFRSIADIHPFSVFWSVCQKENNGLKIKRIDLTAWEAFHHGMMPIVNVRAVPEHLRGIFLEIECGHDTEDDVADVITNYFENKTEMFLEARRKVDELNLSTMAISAVKQAIESETGVPRILKNASALFTERNTVYGNAYKDHAKMMHMLLGDVQLKTEQDHAMYVRISAILAKLNRVGKNFPSGHQDSADDLVVFSAMLAELHKELK